MEPPIMELKAIATSSLSAKPMHFSAADLAHQQLKGSGINY
jgi:hypothetical protein